MQKTEFIKAVAEKAGDGVSQKQAKQVIEAAINVITETLQKGEKVTLTGFGTFEVRNRQEREGVNPQTRERMIIPATRTPGFSASSTLKEAVKEKEPAA
ncbi:MAG: HU family DNA-binding protein [Chloroflexaceae bacterium]|nr:HU family DNA-binding protein [Chloroflexaceae bacterium]